MVSGGKFQRLPPVFFMPDILDMNELLDLMPK